jgi:hypothetical protein
MSQMTRLVTFAPFGRSTYFTEKLMYLIEQKMGWDPFWAIFTQKYLATLKPPCP